MQRVVGPASRLAGDLDPFHPPGKCCQHNFCLHAGDGLPDTTVNTHAEPDVARCIASCPCLHVSYHRRTAHQHNTIDKELTAQEVDVLRLVVNISSSTQELFNRLVGFLIQKGGLRETEPSHN
jgi:hypothetical protein